MLDDPHVRGNGTSAETDNPGVSVRDLADPRASADDPTATAIAAPAAPPGFEELEAAAGIIEALRLGYHLGSAIERIALAQTQGAEGVPKLREAIWLIERHIDLSGHADGAALGEIRDRLSRNGEVISGLQALSRTVDAHAAEVVGVAPLIGAPVASAPVPVNERTLAEDDDPYPLGRELLVMAVRWALILFVIVVVVLVVTLAPSWR